MKTNEFWLGKLEQVRKKETTADQFINWDRHVQALTPADVREAALLVKNAPTRLVAVQLPEKR